MTSSFFPPPEDPSRRNPPALPSSQPASLCERCWERPAAGGVYGSQCTACYAGLEIIEVLAQSNFEPRVFGAIVGLLRAFAVLLRALAQR